jgi:hypothetical protein
MDNQLKQLSLIRTVFVLTIPIYVFLAMRAPLRPTPQPILFNVIAVVAVVEATVAFFLRNKLIRDAESTWRENPNSKPGLARWFTANIVPWAMCLSIAIYGIVLRYLGYSFRSVAPFFFAGALLMFFFPPRRPEELS